MKWIRIKRLDFGIKVIYISNLLEEIDFAQAEVCFGGKKDKAKVIKLKTIDKDCVMMSGVLIDMLCLKEELHYQLKIENNRLIIGPVIGLLMGRQCVCYCNKNMSEFTHALNLYEKTGGLFYAFTPEGVDYEKKQIYGLYFGADKVWHYGCFPFPGAIFRRGFSGNEAQITKIRENVCNQIFNEKRRNKWEMHRLLQNDETVRPFLPDTCEVYEAATVLNHLMKHTTAILKPTDLSRGRGINILQLQDSGDIEIIDCLKKENNVTVIKPTELESFLISGGFFSHHYIVQNRLDLATVNGSPFDIRVVIQKSRDNQWQCSGIECRVAGFDNLISNIARGGRALSVNCALLLAFGPDFPSAYVKNQIIDISKRICKCIDKCGGLFAEFGLDIAIDKNRNLWFIEANVRPSFKGFKIMDYDNYLYICSRPIIYAVHLAGFESDGENR